MFNRKTKPMTRMEQEYLALVRALPCMCCELYGIIRTARAHHIKMGNKRMGHRFVLPFCEGHHVGKFEDGAHYGVRLSVHRHHREFVWTFGTERELWEKLQARLGLPANGWPESKILPRRIPLGQDWA